MSPIIPNDPQQASGFWVLPSIDDPAGGSLRLSVAIAVGDPLDLSDADVQVDVITGGQSLALTQGPAPGVLPAIQLNGINAYAQSTFANPGDPGPSQVQVTVRGGSTTFDFSNV